MDEHYGKCCTGEPWFNDTIYHNVHGPLFKELFVTAREDRYDLFCGLHVYNKRKETSIGATDLHGGWTLS